MMYMKVRLGNYIEEYSKKNKADEDIPVYSVTSTQGFCRDYFGKEVASKDKTTYKIVPQGCFAYNPSRINVGSVDWQRNEERVIVSPLYNVFSVSEELDQEYLYYYLKSDFALQRIRAVATGSVRDNLKLEMLKEFPILLPPKNDQKTIANNLDRVKRIIELKALVNHMTTKVKELNRENFAVRQHLKYVDIYANESNYVGLTYEDTLVVREELAPLIEPENDEVTALRFDALMYGIELAYLIGKKHSRGHRDLMSKVSALSGVANIPEIMEQAELINQILHTDYLANAGINEFEHIRENLRDLMKYIPKGPKIIYDTNFADEILAMEWKESELENDDLKNYKAKAEYYVRQHQDNEAIAKLKSNKPLTSEDIKNLENILWSEIGTKQDYEAEYGEKPLGEFVREIVGLDMTAAKEAFAEYLDETNLDSRQIYFVNQIVEFIVHNGMMKDLSVLQEPPFTDQGSIVEVFTDLSVWMGIRKTIEQVNANALAA